MPEAKLRTTDAFITVDIELVPAAGIVRCARKILNSGAADLARSATYTFASFGHRVSGASAGINAQGDAVPTAIAAFVEEVTPEANEYGLLMIPAKGVDPAALEPLVLAATGGTPLPDLDAALAETVAASVAWVGNGLEGTTVAIEGTPPAPVTAALVAGGATIVEVPGTDTKPWLIWGAEADVILAGSKPGTLTHEGAGFVKANAIVPWGPIPVTTKALAQLRRRGVSVLPDFVTASGSLLAAIFTGQEPISPSLADQVTTVLNEIGDHPEGPFIGACLRAEATLAEWIPEPLFGRPLAG